MWLVLIGRTSTMVAKHLLTCLSIGVLLAATHASATQGASGDPGQESNVGTLGAHAEAQDGVPQLHIAVGDEVEIAVYGAPELSEHARVNGDGSVYLPLLGNVRIAGLSSQDAQGALEKRLRDEGLIRNPQVTISVKEYTAETISVVGEVVRPGIYSIAGPKSLLEIVLLAGGPTEKSGTTATITRRNRSIITVPLKRDSVKSSEAAISVLPGDTVEISKAGIVYVLGEVNRPGGFVIDNNGPITLLQVVAKADGPTRTASLKHVRLLRKSAGAIKETALPLKQIMQGKSSDVPLQAEDIVLIPSSVGKSIVSHSAQSAFALVTSLAIYRF